MHFFIFRLGSDDTTGYEDGVQALFQTMRLFAPIVFFVFFFRLDDAVLEKPMSLEGRKQA